MYGPPPVVVPAAAPPARGGLAGIPLIAVCCLGLILLSIAAVIVLALIPIYLPTRSVNAATPPNLYLSGDLGSPSPAPPTGPLDANNLAELGFALDRKFGVPLGTFKVNRGGITSSGGKRKRRDLLRQRSRRQGGLSIILQFSFSSKCSKCKSSGFLASLVSITIEIELTFNGVKFRLVFRLTLSISPIAIPSSPDPTPTPTTTSASATKALTG